MSFPWAEEYRPKNGFMRWIDQRLPLPRLVYGSVGGGYPVPRNLNYFWNFGVLAGVALMIQIVTGIILAMHYVPSDARRLHPRPADRPGRRRRGGGRHARRRTGRRRRRRYHGRIVPP